MPRAPSVHLLALLPLIATGAAAQSDTGERTERVRLIALGTAEKLAPPELRISRTLSTVVMFDTPLSSVAVEAPQRFRRVRVAGDTLTLVPSAELPLGTRMTLTVYFQDGQPPGRLVLLAVEEAVAERQVEVQRRPRPREPSQGESLHESNQRLRLELEALREENRRLRQGMEPLLSQQPRTRGLGELFANGPLKTGDLATRRVEPAHASPSAQHLKVREAWAYRLGHHVALALELDNTDRLRTWQVHDARLEAEDGAEETALSLWVETRLGPGERGRIVLGAKAPRKTHGPFTLRLQDAEGWQSLTLRNIVFP